MKRCWLLMGVSLVSLLGVALLAHGNEAAPPPPPPPPGPRVGPGGPPRPGLEFHPVNVKLTVEVDEKAKQPRLVVPYVLLMKGAGPPAGALPPRLPVGAPVAPPPALPRKEGADAGALGLPTIVAGLALTAAAVSGGLWLVRRGSRRTLLGVLAVGVLAASATALWADIGPGGGRGPRRPPPPPPEKTTPIPLPAGVELPEKITLEFSLEGDTLRLIVPKDAVLKKAEAPEKRE
jgi:hypothetical protein